MSTTRKLWKLSAAARAADVIESQLRKTLKKHPELVVMVGREMAVDPKDLAAIKAALRAAGHLPAAAKE